MLFKDLKQSKKQLEIPRTLRKHWKTLACFPRNNRKHSSSKRIWAPLRLRLSLAFSQKRRLGSTSKFQYRLLVGGNHDYLLELLGDRGTKGALFIVGYGFEWKLWNENGGKMIWRMGGLRAKGCLFVYVLLRIHFKWSGEMKKKKREKKARKKWKTKPLLYLLGTLRVHKRITFCHTHLLLTMFQRFALLRNSLAFSEAHSGRKSFAQPLASCNWKQMNFSSGGKVCFWVVLSFACFS